MLFYAFSEHFDKMTIQDERPFFSQYYVLRIHDLQISISNN